MTHDPPTAWRYCLCHRSRWRVPTARCGSRRRNFPHAPQQGRLRMPRRHRQNQNAAMTFANLPVGSIQHRRAFLRSPRSRRDHRCGPILRQPNLLEGPLKSTIARSHRHFQRPALSGDIRQIHRPCRDEAQRQHRQGLTTRRAQGDMRL